MTHEPESEDTNKPTNSSLEKKIFGIDVSEISKIVRLVSSGSTLPFIFDSLSKGDLTKAAIFFLICVVVAFWGFIRETFLDTLIEGLKRIGKKRAERYVNVIEQQEKISEEQSIQNAARETEIKQINDFESKYLEEQKYACHEDRAVGIRQLEGIDNYPLLQEIFVPLRLTVNARNAGYDRYELEEDNKTTQIWDLLINSQNRQKLKQIAIHAWGGFGKTTLLKHLAFVYSVRAYGKYKAPKFIPFLIYLASCYKTLSQDNPPSLQEFLTNDHVNKLLEDRELVAPSDWVLNLLRDGQALVMFDGFDEVPISERAKVSKWLSNAMQKYRKSQFILTSRPTAYRENYSAQKPSSSFWIEKFNQEQRQKFVEQWYVCQEILARGGRSGKDVERTAKTRAKSLLDQIKERPELDAIAGNALLLNMMVRYHRDKLGEELPQRKVELYQGICELQLDRRPSLRKIELLLNSTNQRQEVLQFVALEMMKLATKDQNDGFKQIQRYDLLNNLKTGLVRFNNEVNVEQFLAQMVDISEMLVRRDEDIYQFSHLTFQEFLAASELVRLKEEGEALLFGKLNLNAWKDTILFYASLTPNPNRLIQRLVDLDNRNLVDLIYRQTNKADVLKSLEKLVVDKRYQQLEEYLKAKEWEKADRETYRLMITAVGKDEGQYFSEVELRNFPCDELLAIDRLWVKHSYGLYGFSVQKQIYEECGGKLDFSYPSGETWDKFCHLVAWKDKGEYLTDYSSFKKFINKSGHLPYILCFWEGVVLGRYFFSRIATCEL